MRKIEAQMNAAIAQGRDWQSGNTSVHFNDEEQVAIVRLHGNKIAEIQGWNGSSGSAPPSPDPHWIKGDLSSQGLSNW